MVKRDVKKLIIDRKLRLLNMDNSKSLTLRDSVLCALNDYFFHLDDGCPPVNLYSFVLEEVEAPLLESILTYVKGNQSKAAEILGLSRGTLRKKLKQHKLDKENSGPE